MARVKQPAADYLALRDLILTVHGPWDPRSECSGHPTVLWSPRCETHRLRAIWGRHQAAIEQAAAEAGLAEAWVETRLAFCDLLGA